MHHAGAEDPVFLRIGTCGGLGKTDCLIYLTDLSIEMNYAIESLR